MSTMIHHALMLHDNVSDDGSDESKCVTLLCSSKVLCLTVHIVCVSILTDGSTLNFYRDMSCDIMKIIKN
jgi:hypothetical protein